MAAPTIEQTRAVAQDATEFVQFDPFEQVNLEWTKRNNSIRTKAAAALTFTMDGSNETSLILYITNDSCDLYFGKTGAPPVPPTDYTRIPAVELKGHALTYLEASTEVLYWLSVDNDNGVIRYGNTPWLDGVSTFKVTRDGSETSLNPIHISRLPIVRDRSPFVALNQISLLDLENGTFTIPENLPSECQTLYHSVGSPSIVLNTPDFPDFSAAIHYSDEFGWEGTYLRITLGGNSPGVPYVLEIWPVGHYSPVHDHGESYAVIKVLHGTIECTYFETLTEGKDPVQLGPKATFREPAVTWLGEENYQVHQLRNISQDVCCTIQCYQFGNTNNEHHRYFRYVGEKDKIEQFIPNSDMAFSDFRNAIELEWKIASSGGLTTIPLVADRRDE
ncbi:RmlC-like cupin domain-containing protein [Mycena olivaceomarginata]|nr:RmlC-like cupin domain-containing protein [Mycena olivaceomarginata]